jgi:hypothetical protein
MGRWVPAFAGTTNLRARGDDDLRALYRQAKLRGAKLASRKPRRSRGGANPASSLECAAGSPPSRGRQSLGHSTATRCTATRCTATRSTGTRSSVALASVVPAEAGTQRRCGAAIDSPSPSVVVARRSIRRRRLIVHNVQLRCSALESRRGAAAYRAGAALWHAAGRIDGLAGYDGDVGR